VSQLYHYSLIPPETKRIHPITSHPFFPAIAFCVATTAHCRHFCANPCDCNE